MPNRRGRSPATNLTRESAQRLEDTVAAYARTLDPVLRDEIIGAHLGLAFYLARRFEGRGLPVEDLEQVASIGLIRALARFDPAMPGTFGAFATHQILTDLHQYFRDRGWAERTPDELQELFDLLGLAIDRLRCELGREPTMREAATAAGVAEEEALEALEAGEAFPLTPGVDSTAELVTSRIIDDGEARDRVAEDLEVSATAIGHLLARGLAARRTTTKVPTHQPGPPSRPSAPGTPDEN